MMLLEILLVVDFRLLLKYINLRAYMQKCAYWDSDYGSRFEVATTASGIDIELDITSTPSEMCTSTEESSIPYSTYATEAPGGITSWLLKNVWSQAGTVICNGAKPECPCYTGKWTYVNDERMLEGMRNYSNAGVGIKILDF